jgi:Pin2-interacting protein X1
VSYLYFTADDRSRQKHLQSKRLASSSPAALAEILGISTTVKIEDVKPILENIKPTPAELDVKPSLSDLTPKREAEDMVSTSTISVHEYFRQKMRAKAVARQIAAGETPTIEPVIPEPASSSKVAWEGVKMEFTETETPLAFSDSPLPLGPTETKEDRRAAKAKRKAEKEAKRAVKAERKVAEGEKEEVTKKKRKRDRSVE